MGIHTYKMSVRYGAARLEVPAGFENILWLISQEVMRIHPEDMLKFIAAFLEDLLAIRESKILDWFSLKNYISFLVRGEKLEKVPFAILKWHPLFTILCNFLFFHACKYVSQCPGVD